MHSNSLVTQKPVSVNWQTIFMIIPYVWIYAFYRIEKLLMGIVLLVVTAIVTALVASMFFGLDGYLFAWLVSIGIPIYFIRKWSTEWNEKFQTENS